MLYDIAAQILGYTPGRSWLDGFYQRQAEHIKTARGTTIAYNRVASIDSAVVHDLFDRF